MSLPRNSFTLCSRCISLEALRRASSTANPQKTRPLLNRFGTWVRFLFGEAKQVSFTKEIVVLKHRQDKLSPKEWILIYNDIMHTRFRFLMCFLLPSAFFIGIYALQDYNKNGGKVFTQAVAAFKTKSLRRRLLQVRYFIFDVMQRKCFDPKCSTTCLQNLSEYSRSIQILRVSFKKPYFLRMGILTHVIAPRSVIKPNEVLYDFVERAQSMGRGTRFLRQLVYGRAKIDGRRALIEDIFFRSNNLRTFMLHETNAVPKQILDIQKKLLDEGKTKR
ncbi:hypothetical protein M3Y97_01111300 [Aphelenchoides bicaudatus]|nr:hypothetical protein M3Y97_01111300 [Aphelenchoides bicaudatus]